MTLDDVQTLILMHGDTDHIGFADRLHREKGIPAYLHPADADRARLEVKKPNSGWGPVKAGSLTRFLWYSARQGGLRIRPAGELRPVNDGQMLDFPGAPRIIYVPGHTPGSVAVHVPAVDALFIGDTMTTRNVLTGATGPKPAPFTIEPEQAVASLSHIAEVDATWVLPGHGRLGPRRGRGRAAYPRGSGAIMPIWFERTENLAAAATVIVVFMRLRFPW
jgi:glyoxylase-like metal-dependent hydrolase (beta-lactamase superfamily II)